MLFLFNGSLEEERMVGEVGKEGKIEQVQNKRPPQRRRCLLSSVRGVGLLHSRKCHALP